MAKNLTAWTPQGGLGYTVAQTGLYIQDNLGNILVDNSGNFFVPNPFYVVGKYVTSWTASVKNVTSWTVD